MCCQVFYSWLKFASFNATKARQPTLLEMTFFQDNLQSNWNYIFLHSWWLMTLVHKFLLIIYIETSFAISLWFFFLVLFFHGTLIVPLIPTNKNIYFYINLNKTKPKKCHLHRHSCFISCVSALLFWWHFYGIIQIFSCYVLAIR